jgi:hypothetical protein
MKTKFLSIIMSVALLASCNNDAKNAREDTPSEEMTSESNSNTAIFDSKGYELMSEKCFACHLPKPNPAKKHQMIAPPMLRIQEHYKPAFPNKAEFIKATIDFINNPSKEKTLMPGAVKKFNLMPKLIYDEKELHLILETLYDIDFGKAPKMEMGIEGMQLNNGEKWELKPESVRQMEAVIQKVNDFESDNIADYNQLGKDVFNHAKKIILDDSYTGEKFNQIHLFFNGIESNMHTLMSIDSISEAENQLAELKTKLNEFHKYFE